MEAVATIDNRATVHQEHAADLLGVSMASVGAWTRSGALRSKKEGRKSTYLVADIEIVKELREQHGQRKWVEHTPWHQEQEEIEQAEAESDGPTLAGRIVAKAKELKAAGNFQMAYELMELVCDQYDYGND